LDQFEKKGGTLYITMKYNHDNTFFRFGRV
jgi:hypothetical protein